MCCEHYWKALTQNTLTETQLRLREQEARARFEQWRAETLAEQAQQARAWETVRAGEFTPVTTTITGTVTVATTPEQVLVTA